MRAFAESISTVVEIGRIADELATFTRCTWGCGQPVVLRYEAATGSYVAPSSSPPANLSFSANHPLISILSQRLSSLTLAEIEAIEPVAATACREHGWDLVVPIVLEGTMQCFLAIGLPTQTRASSDDFTASDLEALDALAAVAAGAMARARLHYELELSQDAVRRADRLSSLGTLSASVAHEIRNQMVAIQTFLQLLPERLNDAEFLTSFLSLTNDEVKRITTLVSELLASARSSDRGTERECLNHLVERSLTILQPEAKKRQVSLLHELAEGLPEVFINADKIRQVLTNLLLNAIQATPAGGTVTITTRRRRLGEIDRLQIEVRDSGAGITAEHLCQLFSPFFTTKADGTGLGLSIARAIVREHDGEIFAESQVGHGATLTVELPAAST